MQLGKKGMKEQKKRKVKEEMIRRINFSFLFCFVLLFLKSHLLLTLFPSPHLFFVFSCSFYPFWWLTFHPSFLLMPFLLAFALSDHLCWNYLDLACWDAQYHYIIVNLPNWTIKNKINKAVLCEHTEVEVDGLGRGINLNPGTWECC